MTRPDAKRQTGRRLTAVVLSLLMLLQSVSAFADSIDAPETSPEAITEAAEQIAEAAEEVITETTEEAIEEATEETNAISEEATDTTDTTQDPEATPVIDTSESVTMFMPGFMLKPAYFEGTLIHNGPDYTVTAVIGKNAMLPADVAMRVAEVLPGTELYEFYRGMMAETLEEDEEMGEFARLFDIAFIAVIDGEETEIEPAADIDVQITFLEAIAVTEETDVQAVHFDENTPEIVEITTDSLAAAADDDEAIDTLSFTSDSFSIYGFFQKVKKVIRVITASGETFTIGVSFTSDSGIPDDAELTAEEITPDDPEYEAYRARALEALDAGAAEGAFFFDIRISKDGEKIEPEGPVTVAIALDEMPEETAEVAVVHFGEENPEVIEGVEVSGSDIQFQAESFSVYGVITEPGDTSLNGRTATIRRNGLYMDGAMVNGSDPRMIRGTGNANEAAEYCFVSTGESGKYYIYTVDPDTREMRYLNFSYRSGQMQGHAFLSSNLQEFLVAQSGDRYRISPSSTPNMYLDTTDGAFRARIPWSSETTPPDVELNFLQGDEQANTKYVVIVKHNGAYYTVQTDGSLIPCVYHADSNLVEMESPLMWTYSRVNENGAYNLKIPEEALHFDGFQLPDRFAYRYIDPNTNSGIKTDGINGEWPVSEAENCALVYENHQFHGYGNNHYIGVTEEFGKLRIAGNNGESSAAEVYLAIPMLPSSAYGRSNAVNHIDISVTGTANLSLPFAYGTYYLEDGTEIVIDQDHPYTYTEKNYAVHILQEDMMRSEISAYKTNADGSTTSLDNMFYVTGYSDNGKNDGSKSDQVRIEGFFKVAYTDYPGINGDPKSREERLKTKVNYTVTVPKQVTVDLKYNDNGTMKPVYAVNKQENPDAKPVQATTTVTLSASFNYWDENNICPGCLNDYGIWRQGDIPAGDTNQNSFNGSGMDFKLSYTGNDAGTAAIEVIKYVVDPQGNPIPTASEPKYTFDIYYSQEKDPNYIAQHSGVTDPAVLDTLDLESYLKLQTKSAVVGLNGTGVLYDYDVGKLLGGGNREYALVYIKEDRESIDETIVDENGGRWEYTGETRIVTEYVSRVNEHQQETHPDHEVPGLTGFPEVIGKFNRNSNQGHGGGATNTNAFLEFHVYNVYTRKTEINVEKVWLDGNGNPTDPPDEDVTIKLIRYKDGSDVPGPTPTSDPTVKYTLRFESSSDNLSDEYQYPQGTDVTFWFDNGNDYYNPYDNIRLSGGVNGTIGEANNRQFHVTMDSDVTIRLTETGYSNWGNVVTDSLHLSPVPSGNTSGRREPFRTRFDARKLIASNGAVVIGNNSGMPGTYGIIDPDFEETTITLNQGTDWKGKFEELDIYDDEGRLYYYTIEEVEIPGYETTYSQNVPVAANEEDIHITVYNERIPPKFGDISLKKTVSGEGCNPDQEFEFTITIVDENGNAVTSFTGEHGDVTFAEGIATMTLKASDADPKWIRNLPDGTRYTIQETPVEGYWQGLVAIEPEEAAAVNSNGIVSGTITGGVPDGDNSQVSIRIENRKEDLTGKLIVHKEWLDVQESDLQYYPDVYVTLFQMNPNDQNMNQAQIYTDGNGTSYSHHRLSYSDNRWTWVISDLPAGYKYFATEDPSPHVTPRVEGSVRVAEVIETDPDYASVSNLYQIKIDAYKARDTYGAGAWRTHPHDPNRNSFKFEEPHYAYTWNSGEILIQNKAPSEYAQMEVKKKFLQYVQSNGTESLWTTTQMSETMRDMIIEVQMMRMVIDDRNGTDVFITGWEPYGSTFKYGYKADGTTYIEQNGLFTVKDAGGTWAFRVSNNNQNQGLPIRGFHTDGNGNIIPVRYRYIMKEVQVYKADMTPVGGQWTSWLPYAWDPGNSGDKWVKVFELQVAQDQDRMMNAPGTSMTIEKEWTAPAPDVKEVYIKVYRESTGYSETGGNDYLHRLAVEMSQPTLAQDYFAGNPAGTFDRNNEWIVLSEANGWKATINKVQLFPNELNKERFRYWIEEVGYKDAQGIHDSASGFNPVYYKWNADQTDWTDQDNGLMLSRDHSEWNKLKVANTPPTMDIPVNKQWVNVTTQEGDYVKISLFLADGESETPVTNPDTEESYVLTFSHDTWSTEQVFTKLPIRNAAGQAVTYRIIETEVKLGDTVYKDPDIIKGMFGNEDKEVTATTETVTVQTIVNTQYNTDIRIVKRKYKEEGDESPDEILTGAKFRLDRKNGAGTFDPVGDAAEVNGNGVLLFEGLPDGEYQIVETKAPAGYMPLASPIQYTISNGEVNYTGTSLLVTYTEAAGDTPATFTVDNRPGVALPSTGGEGTAPYILTGLALMALAGILLLDRKRKAHK